MAKKKSTDQSIKNINNLIKRIIASALKLDLFIKYHRVNETKDLFIFSLYEINGSNKPQRVISGISEIMYYFIGRLDEVSARDFNNGDIEEAKNYTLSDMQNLVDKYNLESIQPNWSSKEEWAIDYTKIKKGRYTI